MTKRAHKWGERILSPEAVLNRIRPGMSIFLGTGVAEPRTLLKHLTASKNRNLEDLELIQIVSLGDAISLKDLDSLKYRLKTFVSGWVTTEAITAGQVDLIPSRFARIPKLIESKQIPIDVAIVQITPPDKYGYCSFGASLDAARQAMEAASLTIGEINTQIPRTFGDTFSHISDFNLLIKSTEPPIYHERWPVDDTFDRLAANVSTLIEDRSCIAFSPGSFFEALSCHLATKKHLGIHSPFFTDALMDLVDSGAITNRYKETFRGKSLASYAIGTKKLMSWLDRNPIVEFQGIDKVYDPIQIGRNSKFVAVFQARKVDLSGRIALQIGKGNIATSRSEVADFFSGAEISKNGQTIFALPSRNRNGTPNFLSSIENFPNQCRFRESVNVVVSEFGVAELTGKTIRERAQALIDIAHPGDRSLLVEQAKANRILYEDQIFHSESATLYPSDIETKEMFKNGLEIRFRPIKPSDEEEMRRLFYRFSDKSVYSRYFATVKTMPHAKMQEYVNVDWHQVMSIVGVVGEVGKEHIIAEARYLGEHFRPYAEVAFITDEAYQGFGIATYLYKRLVELARERGFQGFTAEVLFSNIEMMKVFKKGGLPVQARLEEGVYILEIPFYNTPRET